MDGSNQRTLEMSDNWRVNHLENLIRTNKTSWQFMRFHMIPGWVNAALYCEQAHHPHHKQPPSCLLQWWASRSIEREMLNRPLLDDRPSTRNVPREDPAIRDGPGCTDG